MKKLGRGGGGREEAASEMHGSMKSTCVLLSLSLLDTLDTNTCCSLNFMELWSVDLRICVTQYNICLNF